MGKKRRAMFRRKLYHLVLLAVTILLVSIVLQERAYAADPSDFLIEDGVLTGYVGADSTVTIPANVTKIGEAAFRYNEIIQSVTIPGSLCFCKLLKPSKSGNESRCGDHPSGGICHG